MIQIQDQGFIFFINHFLIKMAEDILQFELQQYYEVLMSTNLKEKLKPFVKQFRKNNIPFIYQTLVNTILIINDKHKNPLMKFNCLLATKLFFDTGQYIPVTLIQIYLLPIIFDIATYRIQKRSEEGVAFYFVQKGYDQTKEMKRIGYNFVLLAIQFIFMSSQIKKNRTLETFQLNQDSNYAKLCKVLKQRGLRDIETFKFYIPSYVTQTKKKYLRKLQKFRPQEYTEFFMKLICDQMNLNKKAQIDLKKIFVYGDAYITIPLLHICEDELIKMDGNFENKKKYLNLIGDFIKLGDIYSVLILTRSSFLQSIYDNIKDVKGEISFSAGQSIYPHVEASKADKKQFYLQFLKNIQIWAHCHPVDEDGNPTDAKKIYQILKNQKKFIFPSNILISKIRGQMEANLKLNQKRNERLIKIVDEQNQNSVDSKPNSVDSKQKNNQSKMSKKSKSALSAHSFIQFQQLQQIVYKAKNKLQKATELSHLSQTIQFLQKFKIFWQKSVEQNEIQADQSNDVELIMQQGYLCLNVIQMILPIYYLYKEKKISFQQYKDRVDLNLKKEAQQSIKQTSFQYNLPIQMSKNESYEVFQQIENSQQSIKAESEVKFSNNTIKQVSQGSEKFQSNNINKNSSPKPSNKEQKKASVIQFSSLKNSQSNIKMDESLSQLKEQSSFKNKISIQRSIMSKEKSSNIYQNNQKSNNQDKNQKNEANNSQIQYFQDSIGSKKSSIISKKSSSIGKMSESGMKKINELSKRSSSKILSRRSQSSAYKDQSIRNNSQIRDQGYNNRNRSIRKSNSRQLILKQQLSNPSSQNVIQFQDIQEEKNASYNYKNLFNKTPNEQYFPQAKQSFISQYQSIPSHNSKLNKDSTFNKQKPSQTIPPPKHISSQQLNGSQNVYIKKNKKKGVLNKPDNEYDFFVNKNDKMKEATNKDRISKIMPLDNRKIIKPNQSSISDQNFSNSNSLHSSSLKSFNQTSKIPQIKNLNMAQIIKKKQNIQISMKKPINYQDIKKCETFKHYEQDSIIKQPQLNPLSYSFHEEPLLSTSNASKISSFKDCLQVHHEIILSKQNDEKLLKFNKKGKISNFIQTVYPRQLYKSKSNTLVDILSQRNAKNLIENYRNMRQKSRATENMSQRARSIQSLNKNMRIKNVLMSKANLNETPNNFLRVNKTNGSQPVSFYNDSQSSRQKSQTHMKFDPPSISESNQTVNHSRLINHKIYNHYFPQKDYDKTKKCMIKTKSLLLKTQQFEMGCVTNRNDPYIDITLFITPTKMTIDDISFHVIHDQSLKIKLFTQYIQEIKFNQQENITISIIMENVPYIIPVLKMKYRNTSTNQYNQLFITLPASFNKFFIFNELSYDYYLQITKRKTDADYICTGQFKYNKKYLNEQKIGEYFKNFTLTKRQNKISQYVSQIILRGKIFIMKITINERGSLQLYGLNMTGDHKNIKFLQYLLITYRQILQHKKIQKVK